MGFEIVLTGECTPEQIQWMAQNHPEARVRKRRSESCTYAMKRREHHIGGWRYQIFALMDEEPVFLAAIAEAKDLGMRDKLDGRDPYWDFQKALEQGFIEIRAGFQPSG